MSSPTCDGCSGWIEATNYDWPGFCSPACRDRARTERQQHQHQKRQRRRDLSDLGTTNTN